MEENLQIHEKFDAYLRGEMIDEEKAKLDKELQDNPQVKEEFRQYMLMVEGIKEAGKDRFKDKLKEIDKGMADIQMHSRFPKWIAMAASVTIIIGLSTIFLLINRSFQPELYTQYFKPWQNDYPFNTRGEIPEQFSEFTSDQYEELKIAMEYYDKKEYSEAINILKTVEREHKGNADLQFLLGLSFLNNNQVEKSIPYLEELNNKPDFVYLIEVKWFYGLALIYTGNEEDAKKLMSEVVNAECEYSNEAKDILEDISK